MAIYYSPKIVTDSLAFYLDAANPYSYPGAGTRWLNISKTANSGSLVNSPTFSTDNGGYLSFDGTNQYVRLQTDILLNDGVPKTFNIWAYNTNNSVLISDLGYGDNRGWLIRITQTNITFGGSDTGAGARIVYRTSTNAGFTFNTWKNVCVVYDPTIPTVYFYGNGNLLTDDASTIYSTYFASTVFSQISGYGTTTSLLNGRIGSIGIYNKALSAAEVSQNFNALRGRYSL